MRKNELIHGKHWYMENSTKGLTIIIMIILVIIVLCPWTGNLLETEQALNRAQRRSRTQGRDNGEGKMPGGRRVDLL